MEFDYSCQPGRKDWNLGYVKTGKPLVSIITAFYNDSKLLPQTAQCIKNQTFPFFEWIIVDDGSTESGAAELLEQLEISDPRIHVFHKPNGGLSSARNYGLRHAGTELFVPLDSDDLIEPTFLEYCWWMLQKNPEASWSYTASVGFGSQEYIWNVRFDPNRMKTENHLTATAMIRKEPFLQVGGYLERGSYFNEDWHAWLKMMAHGGFPVQSTGEYLFWYRRSNSRMLANVQSDKKIQIENRKLIKSAAETITAPKSPVFYPNRLELHWKTPKLSDWQLIFHEGKKKNHVLFLLPHMVMGGADKFNLDLISGLNPRKFETGIITMIPSHNEWLLRFREVTPNIFNLPNFMSPEDYAEFISYYIKSRQVDVLFLSNAYHGYALVPWLRQHFPELAIVDYVHMEEWYWRAGGYARISGTVGSTLDKTFVCNSATRNVMISCFNREPESVETAYIGVDQEYFSADKVLSGQVYQELQLPKSRPIVLFPCRMNPQKRPFLMLEIARAVKRSLPQVAFVVIGDGPLLQELREKSLRMALKNTVFFLGAKKDIRPYYRDAKLTLICSLKEGLSLTAYESCAMGIPVISADVGGQRDLVDEQVGALIPCCQREDELDRRTFAEEEVQNYASAICELIQNEARWEAASIHCRSRIEDGFTIDAMIAEFSKEFTQLVENGDAVQRRNYVSQSLALNGQLVGEIYTMELQCFAEQEMEDYFRADIESVPQKIRRVLTENGVFGLIFKGIRFIIKKCESGTKR